MGNSINRIKVVLAEKKKNREMASRTSQSRSCYSFEMVYKFSTARFTDAYSNCLFA